VLQHLVQLFALHGQQDYLGDGLIPEVALSVLLQLNDSFKLCQSLSRVLLKTAFSFIEVVLDVNFSLRAAV